VGAVPGQPHQVGDLGEGCLDPVAPLGDDLQQQGGHRLPPTLGRRGEHGGAAGRLFGGECLAGESLVCQQVSRWRPGVQEVGGDLALVHGGGHDAPSADDPRAEVGLDGQPEAVEPFGVRGVAAEPGGQVVARPGPVPLKNRIRQLTCRYPALGGAHIFVDQAVEDGFSADLP
jgi:hypothetical protein